MSTPEKPLDWYSQWIDQYQEVGVLTEFIANMPTAQTALFAFLFLPVLLLGWLMVFRLFDIEKSTRKVFYLIICLAYIIILVFVKLESRKQVFDQKLKKRALTEFIARSSNKCDANSLCKALNLNDINCDKLKGVVSNDPDIFHMSNDIISIVDAEVKSKIAERMDVIASTIRANKDITVDSLNAIVKQSGFKEIEKATLEDIDSENPDIHMDMANGQKVFKSDK